jgi:hypothetical protein
MLLFPFILSWILQGVAATCEICTLPTGECTTLQEEGVLCSECNFRGYYDQTLAECVCWTSTTFNPSLGCLLTSSLPAISREFTLEVSNSYCTPHASWDLGWWKLSDPPDSSKLWLGEDFVFIYGKPHPPTCLTCLHDYLGPPPETVTYSAERSQGRGVACNQVGGVNPSNQFFVQQQEEGRRLERALNGTWQPCSGNGVWDPEERICICQEGWGLVYVGELPDGWPAFTCGICLGPWGPKVPQQQEWVVPGECFVLLCAVDSRSGWGGKGGGMFWARGAGCERGVQLF